MKLGCLQYLKKFRKIALEFSFILLECSVLGFCPDFLFNLKVQVILFLGYNFSLMLRSYVVVFLALARFYGATVSIHIQTQGLQKNE